MSKKSKVRQASGGPPGCIMGGFFGIFAVAGLATAYFLTWLPLSNIIAAKGWEERVCEILSSQVEENYDSEGSTYRIDIRYSYQVGWETYEGDRYNFSTGSSSGYESKRRVVDAHPPGSEVACYVDPDDPSRSVINRNPGGYLWWGLFPIPFLAVGIGGLLFTFVSLGSKKSKSDSKADALSSQTPLRETVSSLRSSQRRVTTWQPLQTRTGTDTGTHGQLELAPGVSPIGKIIGSLFFALFWNGIVSVFLFAVIIPSFRNENPEWFVTIFMIPFVLVGLGLILFFFYSILAYFNPRPRLTLEEGHLTPGGETSLSWRFEGRSGRLRGLTIELEGREWARYRRGTSTYTDRHVFFTEELVNETRFQSIYRGEVALRVPEGTMPSFESSNNGIEWRLKIRGDIPMWPDVGDDFTITVYPS